MSAQTEYSKTPIGGSGTMTYGGKENVGIGAKDKEIGLQEFSVQIAELEMMELNGLVRIDFRHPEAGTGKRYIDLVRFTRFK